MGTRAGAERQRVEALQAQAAGTAPPPAEPPPAEPPPAEPVEPVDAFERFPEPYRHAARIAWRRIANAAGTGAPEAETAEALLTFLDDALLVDMRLRNELPPVDSSRWGSA